VIFRQRGALIAAEAANMALPQRCGGRKMATAATASKADPDRQARSTTNRFRTKEPSMRRQLMVILFSLLVLSGAAPLLSACNTTAGAGEDISSAGHAITGSAERNK
jgi:predicted small secreted protein